MYAYINSVLDANPSVTALELSGAGSPSPYDTATGSVPAGQTSIPSRVAVTLVNPDTGVCVGKNISGDVVIRFIP